MRKTTVLLTLTFTLILAACSTVKPPVSTLPTETPVENSSVQSTGIKELQLSERTDQQGAVTVVVKPELWTSSSETLTFEISLDTHSVDLSFDLAALATLSTDTGLNVQAIQWEAPAGGHHVSGKLSFPARVDGKPMLDGINNLLLTIKNLDASERLFTWELYR
ncbi:MAG: hypothetical protein A2Z27_03165 [candidate division Zixibacteria bacterium RBG_16_50_21]|nr:MAG: hypothetical protein A2Z27_03165 [candidate division Zixibacteria bacterium RBG_16_50_21]